jgi:hypothetical protein
MDYQEAFTTVKEFYSQSMTILTLVIGVSFAVFGVIFPLGLNFAQLRHYKNQIKALKNDLRTQKKRFVDLEKMVWENQGDFFCTKMQTFNDKKNYNLPTEAIIATLRALFCYLNAGRYDKFHTINVMIDSISLEKALTREIWLTTPKLQDAYNAVAQKLKEKDLGNKYNSCLGLLRSYMASINISTQKPLRSGV